MLTFDQVKTKAQQIFPDMQVAFKSQSKFMQVLGKILFFNPAFMTGYTTTIGSTIYYTSPEFIANNQFGSTVILLHELVHIYDHQKRSFIFTLLYLMPQLLVLLSIPLAIFFGWFGLLGLLFLLPLPAYFRMLDERRAYTISLYATHKLSPTSNLNNEAQFIVDQFKGPAYYYMWPFASIDNYFHQASTQIQTGQKPFLEPAVYDLIDKILTA